MKLRLAVPVVLSLLLVGAAAIGASAASGGGLDLGWGGNGQVLTAVGPGTADDEAYATEIDDGKIVVAGYSDMGGATGNDFAVVRYNEDGTLDTGFGGTGKVTTAIGPGTNSDYAYDVAIQSDGKIVAVGEVDMGGATGDDFGLVRYNADGTLDTTFGGTGKVTTAMAPGTGHDDAYDVELQSDGKIVVAGEADLVNCCDYDIAVARYNADGTLDATFDTDGKKTIAVGPGSNTDYAGGLAIQSDGAIVIGGTCYMGATLGDMCFVRLTTAGALDTTFSGDGIATVDVAGASKDWMWAHGVAIDAYGNIVGVGRAGGSGGVVRLTPAGVGDPSFGAAGVATTPPGGSQCHAALIQTDGRILCVGRTQGGDYIGVARFNPNGTLDSTFDGDGMVSTHIGSSFSDSWGAALQEDGAIVAAGYGTTAAGGNDFATVRYLPGTYLYRSDAIINKVGNDIYWGGQKAKVKVMKDGSEIAKIKIQNDGTSGDSFAIEGSNSKGKTASSFAVSYWSGSKNITKKVTDGTYVTGSLKTGEKVTIKMKIKATGSSGHETFEVMATSKGYIGSVDTVKAKAKIT